VVDARPSVFRFGEVEVSERDLRATRNGQEIAIEPKALRVLIYLLCNPGRLVTKEELLSSVWGDAAVTENSLARAIALLRKVLNDDVRQPRLIATVHTAGYRFIGAVDVSKDGLALTAADQNQAQTDTQADPVAASGPHPVVHPKQGHFRWALPVAAVVAAVVLMVGFWYLRRELPAPRITGYTQLTYDGQPKFPAGTDGTRLYFTQGSPRSINQIGVNGGETVPVPLVVRGNKLWLSDVSPDGSTALVSSYDTEPWSLLSTPMLGGSIQHVGDGERGVFSPDGNSILYNTESGEVILARRDGSEPRKLHPPTPDSVGRRTGGLSGFPRVMACGRWRPMVRECTACFPTGQRSFRAAAAGLRTGISISSCFSIRLQSDHRSGLSMRERGSSGGLSLSRSN
jgi:DNA-binding winged helix-turn-helix (wHTH) protein